MSTAPSSPEAYVAAVPAEHRALFDRIDALLREGRPDLETAISYGILRYARGRSKVYLGVWKHGVSLYGWSAGAEAGFVQRHPGLLSGKSTIKLRNRDADTIEDEEFRVLFAAVLTG